MRLFLIALVAFAAVTFTGCANRCAPEAPGLAIDLPDPPSLPAPGEVLADVGPGGVVRLLDQRGAVRPVPDLAVHPVHLNLNILGFGRFDIT